MRDLATEGQGIGAHTVDEVLDSLKEGVAVFDRDLRLQYVNQNARFMLQLRRESAVGLSLEEAFPRDVAATLADSLNAALQGEEVLTSELTSRSPGGTEITLGLAVSQIPRAPLPAETLVVTTHDRSVSREVSRLVETAQAKEEFFSLVSHELRTPLTSIIACADMLLAGFPYSETERTEFLGVIRGEGERLSRLIDEVLDLSRMEANRLTLHMKELDLRTILQAAGRGMAPVAEKSGQWLDVVPGAEPLRVAGDPERLHQVLLNLLGNAIKFTPSGGRIQLAGEAKSRVVEVRVSDTGIGIASDDLHRVFQTFERVEGPGPFVKGTGLGLPITKGLIERMGGRIWAQSSPGEGTTMCFTLPRSRDAE